MNLSTYLDDAGLFFLALVLGGMAFFSFVVAPMVFTQLPAATAGAFIRALFPVYYKVMGGCTLLAGGLLWNTPEAWALAAVVLLFLGAAIGLMPRINRYRDAQLAGDYSAAGPFQRLHRLSVVVNAVQLILVAGVFVRLTG